MIIIWEQQIYAETYISGNVDGLATAFTNGLTSLIDKHAPLRTRTMTERPDGKRVAWLLTITYIEINVLWWQMHGIDQDVDTSSVNTPLERFTHASEDEVT